MSIIQPVIGPPKLERGKSRLAPVSHRGRTRRERAKQARSAARRVDRANRQNAIETAAKAGRRVA